MTDRKAMRAAVRNAKAIEWARTHTIEDLERLADRKRGFGEDVRDIDGLLDELREIERDLCFEGGPVPEMSECA